MSTVSTSVEDVDQQDSIVDAANDHEDEAAGSAEVVPIKAAADVHPEVEGGHALDQKLYEAVLSAIIELLPETSLMVTDNADLLSEKFRTLAGSASAQSEKVKEIVSISESLELGGEAITIEQFNMLFNETLSGAIEKMIQVAKMAMTMVYSMDEAIGQLKDVNSSVAGIQKITRQSNILALNATIEAEKAGEVGKGFAVVACEVKEIAKSINSVSEDIRTKISAIVDSMDEGYGTLRELATTDMSDNIVAKERLEGLTKALLDQNDSFKKVLRETADKSDEISGYISQMTISMQFQDRVAQQIENTVGLLDKMVVRMQGITVVDTDVSEDQKQFAQSLVAGIKLAEVRDSVATNLSAIEGVGIEKPSTSAKGAEAAADEDDDDIELF